MAVLEFELKGLTDQIAHIREVAIKNLEPLFKLFGEAWFSEYILPTVTEASKRTGPAAYLGRITSLQSIGILSSHISPGLLQETLIPQIAVPLVSDKVVNVRIAAAEALVKCGDRLGDKSEHPLPLLATKTLDPES